jgi:hypothetical protein
LDAALAPLVVSVKRALGPEGVYLTLSNLANTFMVPQEVEALHDYTTEIQQEFAGSAVGAIFPRVWEVSWGPLAVDAASSTTSSSSFTRLFRVRRQLHSHTSESSTSDSSSLPSKALVMLTKEGCALCTCTYHTQMGIPCEHVLSVWRAGGFIFNPIVLVDSFYHSDYGRLVAGGLYPPAEFETLAILAPGRNPAVPPPRASYGSLFHSPILAYWAAEKESTSSGPASVAGTHSQRPRRTHGEDDGEDGEEEEEAKETKTARHARLVKTLRDILRASNAYPELEEGAASALAKLVKQLGDLNLSRATSKGKSTSSSTTASRPQAKKQRAMGNDGSGSNGPPTAAAPGFIAPPVPAAEAGATTSGPTVATSATEESNEGEAERTEPPTIYSAPLHRRVSVKRNASLDFVSQQRSRRRGGGTTDQ